MPLTDRQICLLHEVYGLPQTQTTVISGGGFSVSPTFFDLGSNIREQLVAAIAQINQSPAQVDAVTEILAEYENVRLDWSKISRNGYEFKPEQAMQAVRTALFAYTGIQWTGKGCGGGGGKLPLG